MISSPSHRWLAGLVESGRGERAWPGAKPVRDDRSCRPSDGWVIQSLARGTPSSSAHRRRASRIAPSVERACLPFCGRSPRVRWRSMYRTPSLSFAWMPVGPAQPFGSPARRAAVVLSGPISVSRRQHRRGSQHSVGARRESRRLRVAVPAPECSRIVQAVARSVVSCLRVGSSLWAATRRRAASIARVGMRAGRVSRLRGGVLGARRWLSRTPGAGRRSRNRLRVGQDPGVTAGRGNFSHEVHNLAVLAD